MASAAQDVGVERGKEASVKGRRGFCGEMLAQGQEFAQKLALVFVERGQELRVFEQSGARSGRGALEALQALGDQLALLGRQLLPGREDSLGLPALLGAHACEKLRAAAHPFLLFRGKLGEALELLEHSPAFLRRATVEHPQMLPEALLHRRWQALEKLVAFEHARLLRRRQGRNAQKQCLAFLLGATRALPALEHQPAPLRRHGVELAEAPQESFARPGRQALEERIAFEQALLLFGRQGRDAQKELAQGPLGSIRPWPAAARGHLLLAARTPPRRWRRLLRPQVAAQERQPQDQRQQQVFYYELHSDFFSSARGSNRTSNSSSSS